MPPPSDHDYSSYFEDDDYKDERDVLKALKKLGHSVKPFGIFNSIIPVVLEIHQNKPDLVFVLCESFGNLRNFAPSLVGLLELMKTKYTGANPTALRLCQDKGLTKKILSYHRIRVPKFDVSTRRRPLKTLGKFPFPALVKPLELEASEGIAQLSLVENEKDALERAAFIHERFDVDAIIEEYIEGRELYVGVMGNQRIQVFPPQELFFKNLPEGEPRFATFKAKWDQNYRKKWGIDSGPADAIDPALLRKIKETCRKIYRVFQLSGYARIDLRIGAGNEVYFIEANPNPAIARIDDFAQSAAQAGLEYNDMIAKIVSLALE